ncbi:MULTISPECIES: HrpB1 family type III secretion system apparatus protein [unclassified Caballeronia]|uniref:HrpB1 family type III secretion system apparatus protein n=1 Tax=unclassified Caballeronia TaxID=2646786 RepID=UPI0020279975|nr:MULTISPECIES: HrpB1 family type III secretion system apparatus protein [unclassified Caballeronia]
MSPIGTDVTIRLIPALIDVLTIALKFRSATEQAGDIEDLESILSSLQLIRPELIELETFNALIRIRRGDWIGAVQVLSQVEARAKNFGCASALHALALYKMGDESWSRKAREVKSLDGNVDAKRMVEALEACAEFPEVRRGS